MQSSTSLSSHVIVSRGLGRGGIESGRTPAFLLLENGPVGGYRYGYVLRWPSSTDLLLLALTTLGSFFAGDPKDTTRQMETFSHGSVKPEDHCHQTGGVSQTVSATLLPSAAEEVREQRGFDGSIQMPIARRPTGNVASNFEVNVSEVPGAEHSMTVSMAEHTASAIDNSPRTPDWFREFVNSEGEQ